MRTYSIFAPAFAAALGMATVIPDTGKASDLPSLPNGFFSGVNHANGSSTLSFEATGEVLTFKPSHDQVRVQKRTPPFGHTDCWTFQPELNHAGVDAGVAAFRNRLSFSGFDLGHDAGPAYYGFNNDGVYVYFCYNTKAIARGTVEMEDLDFATYWTDVDCGPYKPGFFQWDSPLLFGKTLSGTAVCLGS
ncbi:hypothetical protein FE257_008187 [Aspergillus nanangensis]|uniref:Uncharacterized protein n=1 Tax=Aspergillus nanangensis TaxID=2582783 RepID=A0AAD4CM76_ASPNN|nr:hypothetical protein FE257_008187 [Aspergillus nanangensis]